MNFFFILAGFVILGIIFAIITIFRDKGHEDEASIEPISPEELTSKELLHRPDVKTKKEKFKPPETLKKKTSLFSKLPFGKKKNPLLTPEASQEPVAVPPPKKKFNLLAPLLNIRSFGKKEKGEREGLPPLPGLMDALKSKAFLSRIDEKNKKSMPSLGDTKIGTASIKTYPANPPPIQEEIYKAKPAADSQAQLSKEEEHLIEEEIHLKSELDELKEKHTRVEKILKEKTDELEKIKWQLDNELKNKKEFNRVKDILEKELSDTKDKTRKIQTELNTINAETESYKKRVNQLEEKATKLEKTILEKEEVLDKKDKQIDDLVKRLQAFAASPPLATNEAPIPSEQKPSDSLPTQPLQPEQKEETPQQDEKKE